MCRRCCDWDPSVLTFNSASLGSLLSGWSFTPAPDNTDGEINLLATSTTGLGGDFSGTAFSIQFTLAAGATGSTTVSIGSTYPVASPTFDTEVDDETSNPITLNPAPTNDLGADPVAGTVTVSQAPAITSADSATFTAGVAGTFIVTTSSGEKGLRLSESGLPSGIGLTFADKGAGTATLASTTATPAGDYSFTIIAHNGAGADATQTFTLTVSAASQTTVTLSIPNVTAAAGSTVTVPITLSDGSDNLSGSGMVGNVQAVLRWDPSVLAFNSASLGSLLSGWSFTPGAPDNTDGEINLLATSTTGLGGDFSGTAFSIQFTLAAGATGSTTVSIGSTYPVASPTFDTEVDDETSNPIALNPAPTNDLGADPVAGTVTVEQGPAITSADAPPSRRAPPDPSPSPRPACPPPRSSESGLPSGKDPTFTPHADGTATLTSTADTPAGDYPFTITAHNGAGADATQNFTLHVSPQNGNQATLSVGNVSAARDADYRADRSQRRQRQPLCPPR